VTTEEILVVIKALPWQEAVRLGRMLAEKPTGQSLSLLTHLTRGDVMLYVIEEWERGGERAKVLDQLDREMWSVDHLVRAREELERIQRGRRKPKKGNAEKFAIIDGCVENGKVDWKRVAKKLGISRATDAGVRKRKSLQRRFRAWESAGRPG
jgi:hypothetical protein